MEDGDDYQSLTPTTNVHGNKTFRVSAPNIIGN